MKEGRFVMLLVLMESSLVSAMLRVEFTVTFLCYYSLVASVQ